MRGFNIVVEELKAAMNAADINIESAEKAQDNVLAQYHLGKYRAYSHALKILTKE